MIEEPFAEGTTWLHKLDAKSKIISALIIISLAATTQSFVSATGFLGLGVVLITFARLAPVKVLKRLAIVNTFTIFLLITLPLTFGGKSSQPPFIPFELSIDGLRIACLIALKTNGILLVLLALLCTSSLPEVGHGLERLGLPSRLCYLVLFSYRYIFLIEQEFSRLLRAAKMRSFKASTTLHSCRTFGYLFGMTLVKSWEHSHRIHNAMVLRGFNGQFISLVQSTMAKEGYLLILGVSTISLIIGIAPLIY